LLKVASNEADEPQTVNFSVRNLMVYHYIEKVWEVVIAWTAVSPCAYHYKQKGSIALTVTCASCFFVCKCILL